MKHEFPKFRIPTIPPLEGHLEKSKRQVEETALSDTALCTTGCCVSPLTVCVSPSEAATALSETALDTIEGAIGVLEETAAIVPEDCAAEATAGLADAVGEAPPADMAGAPDTTAKGGGLGGGPSGGGATCPLGIPDTDAGSLAPLLKALLVDVTEGEGLPLPTEGTERRETVAEVDEDLFSCVTLCCSESRAAFESMIRRPVADAKLVVPLVRDGARRAPVAVGNEVPGGCLVRMGGVGGVCRPVTT
jgi:hypothetical protein